MTWKESSRPMSPEPNNLNEINKISRSIDVKLQDLKSLRLSLVLLGLQYNQQIYIDTGVDRNETESLVHKWNTTIDSIQIKIETLQDELETWGDWTTRLYTQQGRKKTPGRPIGAPGRPRRPR